MPFGDGSYGAKLRIAGLGCHESRISLPRSLGRVDLDLERTEVSARLC